MKVSYITIVGLIQVLLVTMSAFVMGSMARLADSTYPNGREEYLLGPAGWFHQYWLVVLCLPLLWVVAATGTSASRSPPWTSRLVSYLGLVLTVGFGLMTAWFLFHFNEVISRPHPLQG